jgi:hypothetical protein
MLLALAELALVFRLNSDAALAHLSDLSTIYNGHFLFCREEKHLLT